VLNKVLDLVNTIEEEEITLVIDDKNTKELSSKIKVETLNNDKKDCPFKCKSYRISLGGHLSHLPKCVKRPSNFISSKKCKTDTDALKIDKNLKSILRKMWSLDDTVDFIINST
jgi:hypothetical protein